MRNFLMPLVGERTFVVAELSANHNQSLDLAVRTLEAMKAAGADAVKLQTYTADTMTLDCDSELFTIRQGTLWDGKQLHALYREAFTPWEWHARLKTVAEQLGLVFFSTAFDASAVEFLESLGVPLHKVASFEITDLPLIRLMAQTGKPLIISTGIATLADIEEAVAACRQSGNDRIALLKCTSAYPASPDDANLRTIPHLAETFDAIAGISDHTLGDAVGVAAVALGARIVEKHFILDRALGGPDSAFSMEPAGFRRMVDSIRTVEQALGRVCYELAPQARKNRTFSRSLFASRDIEPADEISLANVACVRPFYGLPPRDLAAVLGKRARRAIRKGTPLSWDLVE